LSDDPKPIVLLQNCAISTGNRTVLSNVDLLVRAGEFVIIEGPTGSGKTSLIRTLSGVLPPAGGYGEVVAQPLRPLSLSKKAILRRKLGIATQQPMFIDDETCLANVMLPLKIMGRSASESHARGVKALLEAELAWAAKRLPAELSGGEQARLQLARALIHQPRLLLADEPFAHLDSESVELIESLLSFAHAQGTAIVLTTHRPTQLASRARRATIANGSIA
jgi:putative ABC transport system ATP-binding protein